jgi:hypothetical protein
MINWMMRDRKAMLGSDLTVVTDASVVSVVTVVTVVTVVVLLSFVSNVTYKLQVTSYNGCNL